MLTGEVVDVSADADGRVSATLRDHHAAMRSLRHPDGDLYVMPIAVTPLLATVLDVEIFNVVGLIRQGYDDGSRAVLPLIVEHAEGADTVPAAFSTAGRPLPSIDAVAVEIPKAATEETGVALLDLADDPAGIAAADGIEHISLDRRVETQSLPEGTLDPNLTQIGADRAWEAGLRGDGVRVAVLDTGIDASHPDLVGQVVAQENFTDSPDTVDRVGHGTHVAALVAGTGAAAAGARQGIAPDADLLIGKVLNDYGWGTESEVIAGMEWAAPQADLVSMSLGSQLPPGVTDPISTAVDQLSAKYGTLFVVAAGNSGPTSGSVGSPGTADSALTVGAVDAEDAVAEFSSRGPVDETKRLKPEVVAPGVDVVAARAAGTAMGDPVDATYTRASGTSMATPQVTGAAALLAQQHPDWSGDQLKNALVGSADPIGADGYDAGAGRIDVGDGSQLGVVAQHDVVDLSLPFPHTEPQVETLTWTNAGDTAATMALAADLADRHDKPVDGLSIEPATLTVPAGGTATATLRVEPADLADGLYSGTVTALAPGAPEEADVRLPIGIHAAGELVDLMIQPTAPGPNPTGGAIGVAAIVNLEDFAIFHQFWFYDGPLTIQVPAGRYAVVGDASPAPPDGGFGADPDMDIVAQVGDPDVSIIGDTIVAFDGQAATPWTPTVERVDAIPVSVELGFGVRTEVGGGGFGLSSYSWYPSPPPYISEMDGDPELFAARRPVVRFQADPLAVDAGGAPVEAQLVQGNEPPAGSQTLAAVDVGDGADLSPAKGALAVVTLPADRIERAAITQRASEAGVAMVAFVDEDRSLLTLTRWFSGRWADIPVIAAIGSSAAALRTAAHAGEPVTVTVAPSPSVYDLVLPADDGRDPAPVVSRQEQRRLARLQEIYHHDAGSLTVTSDRRYLLTDSIMNLDSVGPLPDERTAYLTPGVEWLAAVFGESRVALSFSELATYRRGSRQTYEWLRRPIWPGPVGAPWVASACQPLPVARTIDTMYVWLSPFQDRLDGYSCDDPLSAKLTLERDGTVVGRVENYYAEFPVPAEPGDYRLTYEQEAATPYLQRSSTTWSFRSGGGPDGEETPLPLLVVDYGLPLDTANRLTGDTATLEVTQVTGVAKQRISSVRVWTSSDGGVTWEPASVRRSRGRYKVTLPDVADGSGVSLRVDAVDETGSRIEQTVIDAYFSSPSGR